VSSMVILLNYGVAVLVSEIPLSWKDILMSDKKKRRHSIKQNQILGEDLPQVVYLMNVQDTTDESLSEIQSPKIGLDGVLEFCKSYLPDNEQEYLQLILLLADVCVGVWRARSKLMDPNSGEPLEEAKRALRPLDSTRDLLIQSGFEIRDITKQPYDVGMLDKVVTWEKREDLTREMVIETIRPTILYKDKMIKQGEIIVGTPPRN
jgi:hypothetical protein